MDNTDGLLLGKNTPVVEVYSPQLLYPIPRAIARANLGIIAAPPFHGVDLWHAYELSWRDASGKPVARVGRFSVPAMSPNIVESKSFKLYLNSLNNSTFEDDQAARACIEGDISAVAGLPVGLQLFGVDDAMLAGKPIGGSCVDDCMPTELLDQPDASILITLEEGGAVEEQLHSHLLRSLCPVTGQPDWATLWLHYRGPQLDHGSLLSYIIAYRQHQEYHEQCLERMFLDITARCQPDFLHMQAFYTRRGGLDINPFRSTDPTAKPLPRLNRQ